MPPGGRRWVTLLDNLGDASTRSRLTVEGRKGPSIAFDQSVGLRFEVTRPTVVTEVGGFVEPFGVGDPRAADVLVEIHPAHPDGRPDRDPVLASAPVAPRRDLDVITYQPAPVRALLAPAPTTPSGPPTTTRPRARSTASRWAAGSGSSTTASCPTRRRPSPAA